MTLVYSQRAVQYLILSCSYGVHVGLLWITALCEYSRARSPENDQPRGPLSGKVFAITGAAQGIGLATAKLLASRGASLSISDLQDGPLRKNASDIKARYSVDVITSVVDVRDVQAVDTWIQDTVAKLGRLDGAANLAGVIGKNLGKTPVAEQDEADWHFVLDVNLTGLMHCLRAQLRCIEPGGSIVNAASIAGQVGRPMSAAYSASKHGVIGLTRSAAKECGKNGTRVNSIAP
jgi:NAD(P)-dependent dehydrogenase (short-subunit alcohol dehydrogenase family)